ncbi:MAG: hypothetical protein ACHQ5A_08350 [Opitutales bacterium]
MNYQIGVWGTDAQTEFILVAVDGAIRARRFAIGCHPDIYLDQDTIRWTLIENLQALATAATDGPVAHTLLCLPGRPAFWQGIAARLQDFSRVSILPSFAPALELATRGQPGMLLDCGELNAGVAARTADRALHGTGNLGWRLGDAGSDYDVGCRALRRALAELQGWAEPSAVGRAAGAALKTTDPVLLPVRLNGPAVAPQQIASLAAPILELAATTDPIATGIVRDAVGELAHAAARLRARLFVQPDEIVVGLRGAILQTAPAQAVLGQILGPAGRFVPVRETPAEGLRTLLSRTA